MIALRKNHDFRLWIGEAASMLGTQLSNVAFPLLVLELTGSPFRAGVVGTVGLVPVVFALFAALGSAAPSLRKAPPAVFDA